MNVWTDRFPAWALSSALLLGSCAPEEPEASGQGQRETAPRTNRLAVPPDVVNNLGITFATATRGRLGVWEAVPGELEVAEHRRWTVRAPVDARVASVVPRWQAVGAGAEVAVLSSSEVLRVRRAIDLAERTLQRASAEVAAARARLVESEAHLLEAGSLEEASRRRLEELRDLRDQGNALTSRDLIEAQRLVMEASGSTLDAAITRDELASLVAVRSIDAEQARLALGEELSVLAVMTGTSVRELAATHGGEPLWRSIEQVTLRSPASGTVVELLATAGEYVKAGEPVARVYDTSQLHFHGHLPEGDLGILAPGNLVRLELPSPRLAPIETRLERLLPVADEGTRMIHVVADVANPDGMLPHGISVTARVRIRESDTEEVLIPEHCVVLDGLEAVVFKRDPRDPNVVIRTPLELGARAAGRVEVLAGVLDGEQVVADGALQLKQTGLGKAPEGGHFHADGTWHGDHG